MTQEKDYLTLDEIEAYTGIRKNSLYYYLKTLGIETHKFTLDKRAYISLEDANRIKTVKETPWLVGEKPSQKREKQPALPQAVQHKDNKEKPSKRVYNRKQDTSLPEGCILAIEFGRSHGLERGTFRGHYEIGLGPKGEKEKTPVSSRPKPGREKETEYYLTRGQQEQALDFWEKHKVKFALCEDEGCICKIRSGM